MSRAAKSLRSVGIEAMTGLGIEPRTYGLKVQNPKVARNQP